ncbi:hypothetical protein, partial [Pseudomonas viridiflava]|uniref:hypothetical protein n=1 Tax=Pseudomonas viridiflava TaxID=33069 RepID=UPI0019D19ABF
MQDQLNSVFVYHRLSGDEAVFNLNLADYPALLPTPNITPLSTPSAHSTHHTYAPSIHVHPARL